MRREPYCSAGVLPKNTTRVTVIETLTIRTGRVEARRGLFSDRDSQLDPVVGCVHQILFGTEVPLGRLHRCVAEQ
jgi:hypothetical protein